LRLSGEKYSEKDPFRVTFKPPFLGVIVDFFSLLIFHYLSDLGEGLEYFT
jgi:hypothetical protein